MQQQITAQSLDNRLQLPACPHHRQEHPHPSHRAHSAISNICLAIASVALLLVYPIYHITTLFHTTSP
ncbi:hypothetical protein ACN47E_003859 [Coniothyrium glycines]